VKRAVVEEDAKGKKVLHAPVHVQDVVRALWRQHFIAVSEDRVTMASQGISAIGRHEVNVIVGEGAKKTVAKLSLIVEQR
jgi:ribosomal protein L9